MAQSVSFQFHNGTIKTQAIRIKWQTVSHFNSMMVQLKHTYNKALNSLETFQFHDGTIKTKEVTLMAQCG